MDTLCTLCTHCQKVHTYDCWWRASKPLAQVFMKTLTKQVKKIKQKKKGEENKFVQLIAFARSEEGISKTTFLFFLLCHTELSVSDYNWLIVWQSTFLFLLLLSTDTKWLIKNLWANFKQVKKLIVFCLIYLKTKKS